MLIFVCLLETSQNNDCGLAGEQHVQQRSKIGTILVLALSHNFMQHDLLLSLTWCHMSHDLLHDLTWCHMISNDVTWSLTWSYMISHDLLHDVTWCHMILHANRNGVGCTSAHCVTEVWLTWPRNGNRWTRTERSGKCHSTSETSMSRYMQQPSLNSLERAS